MIPDGDCNTIGGRWMKKGGERFDILMNYKFMLFMRRIWMGLSGIALHLCSTYYIIVTDVTKL